LIKEPKRGEFDLRDQNTNLCDDGEEIDVPIKPVEVVKTNPFQEFKDSLSKVITNPVAKWTTIAGCFRFFETFSIVYFLPSFF
jgi:hypothetical protein